jgi:hypothetical protein
MFGFFIGAACLFGLGMMWKRARWRRWHGYGGWGHGYGGACAGRGGWDDGPWAGPHDHGFRRARGFGPLGWLFRRLDATPEQERVIRAEVEAFLEKGAELKRELRLSRDDVANAVRAESFDEEVMGESFARQDDRIKDMRGAFVGALARIHDVLDERQRRRLADLLDSAPMRRFGPYRM